MSREDGILAAAFGIVTTFLIVTAVLTTLGSSATAAAWVQAIGSVGAIAVAAEVFRRQNHSARLAEKRAQLERVRNVRVCLAAELDLLLQAVRPVLAWRTNGLDSPSVALSTLGTLMAPVYHGIIPQLGILHSDLAAEIVSVYASLEHLIARGRETEQRLKTITRIGQFDDDAEEWLGSLERVAERMANLLNELRPSDFDRD